MTIELNNNWNYFDQGKSIGKKGSENGTIIFDIENINGARITLEQKTDVAPFSTTLGIYGLMFHTHHDSSQNNAKTFIEQAYKKINFVFEMLEIPEEKQDNNWKDSFNNLIDELAEQKC